LFLLALVGWGAFAQATLTRQRIETELRRDVARLAMDVSRLAMERERAHEQERVLRAELEARKSELAAAQKGITGLITALEKSRAELSALKLGPSR
jgi:chromosome segregation ATPase